jgi:hypothetical protein
VTHRLTSTQQIQEGHVGEDLERDGPALEGGRSNALANRRSRNGPTSQRPRLPPRRPTKHQHHNRRHARQQIQHLPRLSLQRPSTHPRKPQPQPRPRTRLLPRAHHPQPQPPASLAPLAPNARLLDIARASPHGPPQQRRQLAWRKLAAETQSRQCTVVPNSSGSVHSQVRACTATFGRNHHAAIEMPSAARRHFCGSRQAVLMTDDNEIIQAFVIIWRSALHRQAIRYDGRGLGFNNDER